MGPVYQIDMYVPNKYRFPFAMYPAVRIALLLAAGIVTAHTWNSFLLPLLSGVFLSLCMLFFFLELLLKNELRPFVYRLSTTAYLAILFLFGMIWYDIDRLELSDPASRIPDVFAWEEAIFNGTIRNIHPTVAGKYQLDIDIDTTILADSLLWEIPYRMRAVLDPEETAFPQGTTLGSVIEFKASIYPKSEQRNPHEFDYQSYLAERKIHLQAGIDSVHFVRRPQSKLSWVLFRQCVLDLIDQNFEPEVRPLAKALLIGYKNDLDPDEKSSFSRAGLSHIMAVSGLHVGFVIAPFWLLIPWFWSLRYGKHIGLVLLVLLLAGYAGLTGFSASVSRAALTGGFITYGKLFHKVRDSINLTAVSAVILLLIDPGDLFNPGFQLSFGAVFIILLVLPTFSRILPSWIRYRWYGTPLMVILVSATVQAGLYPLLVYHFGEFSIAGPATNALVVPALGLIVPYALALLPVSAVFPGLASLLNYPNEQFLTGLHMLVARVAVMEGSWIQVRLDSPLLFLIWTAAVLTLAAFHIPDMRWKMVSLFLFCLTLQTVYDIRQKLTARPLKVTFFDVGQGDAALVQSPSGKNILVDTGRWSPGYNSAQYIIIPHLKKEGIGRLEAVFLSHPHADHIGGATELLNHIAIDTLYNSGYRYRSNLYRSYLELADKKSIPIKSLKAGDRIRLDQELAIRVYGPVAVPFGENPNEHSLVLEMTFGNTEFLFMGDAGREQEERLVTLYGGLLDTDILKVGHHGSRTSSSERFLSVATPDIAVVSLDLVNRYRHPHPEAVRRIRYYSKNEYFTSLDKALIFATDGKKIKRVEW